MWARSQVAPLSVSHRAAIHEAYAPRVEGFELQAKDGDTWTTFARGRRIGEAYEIRFEPVTARVVRLNIVNATEGPTIWEFQLFRVKEP